MAATTNAGKANTMPEAELQAAIGLHDEPRARTALRLQDWQDPVALRERLAEIHTHDFISPRTAGTERATVAMLRRLTGLDTDTIRAYAREDAEIITAAESDAH